MTSAKFSLLTWDAHIQTTLKYSVLAILPAISASWRPWKSTLTQQRFNFSPAGQSPREGARALGTYVCSSPHSRSSRGSTASAAGTSCAAPCDRRSCSWSCSTRHKTMGHYWKSMPPAAMIFVLNYSKASIQWLFLNAWKLFDNKRHNKGAIDTCFEAWNMTRVMSIVLVTATGALPGAAAVLKHFPSPAARARSFFKNKWFIFAHQQGQISSVEGTESSAETTVSAATQNLTTVATVLNTQLEKLTPSELFLLANPPKALLPCKVSL